jgi:hypothetical protein
MPEHHRTANTALSESLSEMVLTINPVADIAADEQRKLRAEC